MLKQSFARPPMGWNSYDNYDTNIDEAEFLRSCEVVRDRLLPHGWEYAVIDIQWYAGNTGSMRDRFQYIPFGKVTMDGWGRLQPDPDKFPSSAGGKGFGPIAEKVHAMGLKFGIHIMRGIPRLAAHQHLPVLGADVTADMVANPSSICGWNPDMYGVRDTEAGQAWYDSIIRQYAEWGVDYIKCDDICNTNLYPSHFEAGHEIDMLKKALDKVDRDIVLSLSPGPALLEQSWRYAQDANLWRITDDFWDEWRLLKDMFVRCERWQDHVREGCYPDCDMLPLGYIGEVFGNGRRTNFTPDEQKTMLTLWSIFRSPLMLGAKLTGGALDPDTAALLTCDAVYAMNLEGQKPRQLFRCEEGAAWRSDGPAGSFAALFNLSDEERTLRLPLDGEKRLTDLWTGETRTAEAFEARLRPHACAAVRIG